MKIFTRIIKIIFTILLSFVLLIGMLSLLTRARPADKMPSILDTRPLNVLGNSMDPSIKYGSIIFVKDIESGNIQRGDIITFRPQNKKNNRQAFTTHRVIKVLEKNGSYKFKTKGDANKKADGGYVGRKEILGKVVLVIPYAGELGFFAKSPRGYFLLILLPGVSIILLEIMSLIKQLKENMQKRYAQNLDN